MKLDILVISAHPDDAELGAAGTLIKAVRQGRKVGMVDLTRGELGSRGTPETRMKEAARAAEIIGAVCRENVGLPDGFLLNSKEFQVAIVPFIRKYQPDVVITNAVSDRHPDHGRGSQLTSDACFLSGLRAVETRWHDGSLQEAWRPRAVYHFVQDRFIHPDFVVDITDEFDSKMEAVKAFTTQFFVDPNDDHTVKTPISTPEFMHFLQGRAREYGRIIGTEFGEGFTVERAPGVEDILGLR